MHYNFIRLITTGDIKIESDHFRKSLKEIGIKEGDELHIREKERNDVIR